MSARPSPVRAWASSGVARAGAVLAASSLAVLVAVSSGFSDLRGRGLLDGVVGGILVLCARRAYAAPDPTRRRFWRVLALAFALLSISYVTSALGELGLGDPLDLAGVATLLASYPFLLGALCMRAVSEEGVEGGVATSLDLAIVVSALVSIFLPVFVLPLLRDGTAQALGDAITWAANFGLLGGALWVQFRLPRGRNPGGVMLITGALALACALTLVQVLWQTHPGAGPLPWWLVTGFGAAYLMVAAAPRRDVMVVDTMERQSGPTTTRAVLPHVALLALGTTWCVSLVIGADLRVLGSGLAAVSILVVARQLVLLREYRTVIGEERLRVRELTVTQSVARVLASTLDLDAVLSEVVRAAGEMLSAPGRSPRVATIMRLEGTTVCSVAAWDPERRLAARPASYELETHPVLRQVAQTRRAHIGQFAEAPMAATTAALVEQAGLGAYIVAPLEVDGAVYGLLSVSCADDAGFDQVQLERLETIVNLADLAIGNAQRYAREREAAYSDVLTGLRNRRDFERALESLPRTAFALLAIDVDNLKAINDEYGHEAGDTVLQSVATTLSGLLRGGDVLARLGGDEFGALLHGADSLEARAVAERMQQALHGVSVPRGFARISAGYAAGTAVSDPRAVWRAADEALFRAKRLGRDRVEGHLVPGVAAPALTRSLWVEMLHQVLDTHSIGVAFQPIVRLEDRSLFGFEALARPTQTLPDTTVEELFAAAQTTGMLRDLDWLCRRAAVANSQAIPEGLPIFVNISSAALLDPVHSVDQMLLLCAWAGRRPSDIVLEMSERESIPDLRRLRLVVAAYREHGFRFAVDDVGDGHSTLEVLSAAVPEFVKVARTLVVNAHSAGPAAAIRAAVEFVRVTGSCVVAEGVETEEQARTVRQLGVTLAQGWLFGKPTVSQRAIRKLAGSVERSTPARG